MILFSELHKKAKRVIRRKQQQQQQQQQLVKKIVLVFSVRKSQNSNRGEKKFHNSTVFAPGGHFVNEISNQPTARLSEKRYCNWVTNILTRKIISSPRAVKIQFL